MGNVFTRFRSPQNAVGLITDASPAPRTEEQIDADADAIIAAFNKMHEEDGEEGPHPMSLYDSHPPDELRTKKRRES